jgi:hypothetical protein
MAGSASRAQLMRAPRTAALSSGYETHSGVSLANQQTIDQRRHLQTRANNNAQQSFLSVAALAYQSVTQFFIAVRLRAAKQTGLILGNDDSARGNGGSNASKQQTENILALFRPFNIPLGAIACGLGRPTTAEEFRTILVHLLHHTPFR